MLQKSSVGDPQPDAAWIESQIGVLKSQNVAAYVVKQLRLADDPEFTRSGTGLLDKLLPGSVGGRPNQNRSGACWRSDWCIDAADLKSDASAQAT